MEMLIHTLRFWQSRVCLGAVKRYANPVDSPLAAHSSTLRFLIS